MELKDLPRAFYCENGEGPVLKLLKSIKDRFDIGNASGALYELEVASVLQSNGEVISFGEKLRNAFSKKDFDIATLTKLIECKAIDWETKNQTFIENLISVLKQQSDIATDSGKEFVFYSKHKLTDFMKKSLKNKNIFFIEG